MTAAVQALVWDATFPLLRLTGRGTRQFLHGQTSAAMQQAPDQRVIRSCWLTATGRVQALLEVRLDPDGADVLVLCGDAQAVLAGFERVIFPADRVKIAGTSPCRRLQRLRPAPLPPDWDEDVIWPTDGNLPESWGGAKQASQDHVEHWRVSQGLPFSPAELNGDTNPLELGLGAWVSVDKGCYLGQETVAKLASRDGVKQQLRCWTLTPTDLTAKAPSPGDTLIGNGNRAGTITSAVQHGNSWQGLALIRRSFLTKPNLELPNGGHAIALHQPPAFKECGGDSTND
ncbi:MAG: YgfZ/GcvT domain-containing protein [Synechococcus sp.]